MDTQRTCVYTVSPTNDFAETLVAGLIARLDGDLFRLPSVTIYVPNRRAQRSLRDAFLRRSAGKPTLLPVMRPIGEVDEDEVTFLGAGTGIDPSAIPPAIASVRRTALLARQIVHWVAHLPHVRDVAPPQAWRLATELARLMDQIDTEGLDYKNLNNIVPDDFAQHWGITTDFLSIIFQNWSLILDEEKAVNPAVRRNKMMALLSELLETTKPAGMIIAAGTTGTLPATRRLLKAIQSLPDGHIILPGFDTHITDDTWNTLDYTHPQAAMKDLLGYLKIDRSFVQAWSQISGPVTEMENQQARLSVLSDALLPAAQTALWQQASVDQDRINRALEGFELLIAPTRREEAEAIALMLREVLETPGKTAALVTPDRVLARYVRMALTRFDIVIDDTGGDRALISIPGRLLSLVADLTAGHFAPVSLLALLKHPLVQMGMARRDWLRLVRKLDRFILRGPRPASGIQGLYDRLQAVRKTDTRVRNGSRYIKGSSIFSAEELQSLSELFTILKPLDGAIRDNAPLGTILECHLAIAETLSRDQDGVSSLWKGEAGQALADALTDLLEHAADMQTGGADGYASLFQEMLSPVIVRPVWGRHPRLFIWGPLEARMQRADRMILAGLNEGTWPSETNPDPWLNREMRVAFGLPPVERRIGQSAHDFVQAACAQEVFLSRSEKVDSSPTVASRWLFRLEALCGPLPSAKRYLHWSNQGYSDLKVTPCKPPEPKPPVTARPTELSVTQVETWLRDPYALYAAKILDLSPLDAHEETASGKHKGVLIHDALEKFLKLDGPTKGQAGYERLLDLGREAFEPVVTQPGVYAFWWPRFERAAKWFIEHEMQRLQRFEPLVLEEFGSIVIADTGFTVKAKADRIDRNLESGALAIIDYKTGTVPSVKQATAGYAPQLPLEALIAQEGGFKAIPKGSEVESLEFWKISGGTPEYEIKNKQFKDIDDAVELAYDRLLTMITTFAREDTAYLSHPKPAEVSYHDYDHLARVKEWQGSGLEDDT
ncbi:double-strand break repair protein AddB [Kordiimonas sediminis]|nr:double-strand break repair protein AddB [Kordiimonas sediminis]